MLFPGMRGTLARTRLPSTEGNPRQIEAHHGQGGVLVEHGEAQAIHEKVESFIHVIEEDLGNESEHHRGGI